MRVLKNYEIIASSLDPAEQEIALKTLNAALKNATKEGYEVTINSHMQPAGFLFIVLAHGEASIMGSI